MKKIILTARQEREIIDYYLAPHSMNECVKKFKLRIIKKILIKNNIKLHNKTVTLKIQQDNNKKTCLEKYGVNNVFKADKIKNKIKKTFKNKTDTEIKEIKDKRKQTNLKKYGTKTPAENKKIKQKTAEILKQRTKEEQNIINEKREQTNLKKYGVKCTLNSAILMSKTADTCMKKYGVKKLSDAKEIREKAKQTLLARYNIAHAPSFKYCVANDYFDSFPELCFYLYNVKNNHSIIHEPICLNYFFENKNYNYYPDFKVDGKLVEIKGKQFLKEDGTWQCPFNHNLDALFEAKHQCAIQNNVKILYNNDYKKYIDWFYRQNYKKEDFAYNKKDGN